MDDQSGNLTLLLVLRLNAGSKEYISIFVDCFLTPWGVIVISS